MSLNFDEYIKLEFKNLNRKIDRISTMITQLPVHQNTNLGDWLNEEETRELLQKGNTSLWGLRKTKKIEYTKIGGKIYYSRESILKMLEKNKI